MDVCLNETTSGVVLIQAATKSNILAEKFFAVLVSLFATSVASGVLLIELSQNVCKDWQFLIKKALLVQATVVCSILITDAMTQGYPGMGNTAEGVWINLVTLLSSSALLVYNPDSSHMQQIWLSPVPYVFKTVLWSTIVYPVTLLWVTWSFSNTPYSRITTHFSVHMCIGTMSLVHALCHYRFRKNSSGDAIALRRNSTSSTYNPRISICTLVGCQLVVVGLIALHLTNRLLGEMALEEQTFSERNSMNNTVSVTNMIQNLHVSNHFGRFETHLDYVIHKLLSGLCSVLCAHFGASAVNHINQQYRDLAPSSILYQIYPMFFSVVVIFGVVDDMTYFWTVQSICFTGAVFNSVISSYVARTNCARNVMFGITNVMAIAQGGFITLLVNLLEGESYMRTLSLAGRFISTAIILILWVAGLAIAFDLSVRKVDEYVYSVPNGATEQPSSKKEAKRTQKMILST
jgi:uncharacterized protein YacL